METEGHPKEVVMEVEEEARTEYEPMPDKLPLLDMSLSEDEKGKKENFPHFDSVPRRRDRHGKVIPPTPLRPLKRGAVLEKMEEPTKPREEAPEEWDKYDVYVQARDYYASMNMEFVKATGRQEARPGALFTEEELYPKKFLMKTKYWMTAMLLGDRENAVDPTKLKIPPAFVPSQFIISEPYEGDGTTPQYQLFYVYMQEYDLHDFYTWICTFIEKMLRRAKNAVHPDFYKKLDYQVRRVFAFLYSAYTEEANKITSNLSFLGFGLLPYGVFYPPSTEEDMWKMLLDYVNAQDLNARNTGLWDVVFPIASGQRRSRLIEKGYLPNDSE